MTTPFQSSNAEAERLAALQQYELTAADGAMDGLAALAGDICQTPIAQITLVGAHRQILVAASGDSLEFPPIQHSFCAQVVATRESLVVFDARADERFIDNPQVHAKPPICFYAGWPLTTPGGQTIGTLCVLDYKPRTLSQVQYDGLDTLSRQVITNLELVRERRAREQNESRLRVVAENAHVGLTVVDASHRYVYTNPTYVEMSGATASDLTGTDIRELLPEIYEEQIRPRLNRAFAGERVTYVVRGAGSTEGRYFEVHYQPAWRDGRVDQVLGVVTDITQYSMLQDASRRLAAIVESSIDAMITKDLDGVITSWNHGAENIFGYSAQEMIGASINRVIPEERRQEESHILEQIRAGRNIGHFDTQRLTRDGRFIDVSVAESPLRDVTGAIIGASKVARDITAQKQSDTAIRMQRDRTRQYFDTAGVILLALDMQGRVVHINRFGCELLGWKAEELAGKSFIDVCVPGRIRDAIRERLRVAQSGDTSVSENPVLTRSGRERLIEWRPMALRDAHGKVEGTLASGMDVTDQREAEKALHATTERMRFAMESTGVGIWDMDYKTGMLQWSEILERLHGLAPGSFKGTLEAYIALVHPDDREMLVETVERAYRTGRDFSVSYRIVMPDGKERWLAGNGKVLLDEQGTLSRAVGIATDITERHLLEQQYYQAQKMEAIGRLAGGVAHDLNNLLTSILGHCELLLSDLTADGPGVADILEIQKAGNLAAALTGQLLAFSRKQIVAPEVLDLNRILENMQEMLKRLIGEDIRVVMNLRPGVQFVQAERGQMEQVVMNLAVNARDAMPQGGTLTIETDNVVLDNEYASHHVSVAPGPYVALVVSDTGIGMTPEVQSRLFEPFFTTKEVGKGTGLGLASVHGIVTRCGGSVGVYSEIDRGSSFRVYLPVHDGEETAAEPSRRDTPITGTETVLVVEDVETLRTLAKRQLTRQGYEVLVAADAAEALQVLAEHRSIDVLLTDVVMPGTSGPELVAQLMEGRPELKVIYMSGFTEDAFSWQGALEAASAFVQKPFSSVSLGKTIREVLDT